MNNKKPKLYEGQKNTLNYIGRTLKLDKMYLYRYAGNYRKIKMIPFEIVTGIAKVEEIDVVELYDKMLDYALKNSKGGK